MRAQAGFISLPELAGFFGTETRRHMLDGDYLSAWFPKRATERREYLTRIGKTIPFCFAPDNCLHQWELPQVNLAAIDDALASQLRPADSQMYLVVAEKSR